MLPLFTVLLVGYVVVFSAQLSIQQTYSAILGGRTVDTITLQCRNNSGSMKVNLETNAEVVFFINNTVGATTGMRILDEIPGVALTKNGMSAIFRITRDIEGYYSCGLRDGPVTPIDQLLRLISTETSGLPVNRRRRYAVQSSERSVTLQCPYEPGSLQSCYFGQWTKDDRVIVEVGTPDKISCMPQETMMTLNKYQLNRETFNLTISDLAVSDSGTYKCQLELLNPATPNGDTRSFPGNIELNLTVDGEPFIMTGPKEVVIGVDSKGENLTQNAVFTCTAIGLPAPKVSWLYFPISTEGKLNNPIRLTSMIDVTANYTEESGRFVTTYQISVPVTDNVGGVIRCQTGSESFYKEARLTVLGRPNNIGITITTRGEIIYEIELSAHILHPVLLNFSYSSGGQIFRRNGPQPTEPYNNTRIIVYREIRDRLPSPCIECFVVVSLSAVVEGNLTQGRNTTSALTIAELERQAMKHEQSLLGGVIFASTVAGILIVCIISVALTCCFFKYKQKREVNDLKDRNALLEGEKTELRTQKDELQSAKVLLEEQNTQLQIEKQETIQRCKDDRVIDQIGELMKGFKRIESYSDDKGFHTELEDFVEKAKKVITIIRTQTDSNDSLQVHKDGFHQIKIVTTVLKYFLEVQIKK